MSERNAPLRVQKRLLQFNNIPFLYGEITEQTYTVAFKGESIPYTNSQHGSYYPHMGEYGVLQASQFNATITFDFKDIACGDKPRYARFIKRQLARSGKLWAVQNGGEVIWANARVLNINESVADGGRNTVKMVIAFELVDGFWRYAWGTRTFIAPYCTTRFTNFDDQYCWEYEDGKCDITGQDRCIQCHDIVPEAKVTSDYRPLCSYSRAELTDMLGSLCPKQFHILYDCDLEREYFCNDAAFGDKYRLQDKQQQNTTTIDYCSRTDLPTTMLQIRLVGDFNTPPTITVNGETMSINHTWANPNMVVAGFGTGVSYWTATPNRKKTWEYGYSILPKTTVVNIPYFEIKPGHNTITVTGNQMDKYSYVYIKPVEITF